MKILSTRTFSCDDAGLPVSLPPPRLAFVDGGDDPAQTVDVGAAWLAATGVLDAEHEALVARAVAVASIPPPEMASTSDAWLVATGVGFVS
jgi:hypothetical protein